MTLTEAATPTENPQSTLAAIVGEEALASQDLTSRPTLVCQRQLAALAALKKPMLHHAFSGQL